MSDLLVLTAAAVGTGICVTVAWLHYRPIQVATLNDYPKSFEDHRAKLKWSTSPQWRDHRLFPVTVGALRRNVVCTRKGKCLMLYTLEPSKAHEITRKSVVVAYVTDTSKTIRTEIGGFREIYSSHGVRIGTDPMCEVRLRSPGPDPIEARVTAHGHHRFLTLAPGSDAPERQPHPESTIIDESSFRIREYEIRVVTLSYYPLQIGPWQIRLRKHEHGF